MDILCTLWFLTSVAFNTWKGAPPKECLKSVGDPLHYRPDNNKIACICKALHLMWMSLLRNFRDRVMKIWHGLGKWFSDSYNHTLLHPIGFAVFIIWPHSQFCACNNLCLLESWTCITWGISLHTVHVDGNTVRRLTQLTQSVMVICISFKDKYMFSMCCTCFWGKGVNWLYKSPVSTLDKLSWNFVAGL